MTLSEWRKKSGLNLKEFSEKIGCSIPSACQIENGNNYPRPEVLKKIAIVTKNKVNALTLLNDLK
jgi:transcriptional regulator with XRE-family HTH domain